MTYGKYVWGMVLTVKATEGPCLSYLMTSYMLLEVQ